MWGKPGLRLVHPFQQMHPWRTFNLLIPIWAGCYQQPATLTVVRSSSFLKQTMVVCPGRRARCRFLNQVKSPLTQRRQRWAGSIHRMAGFPSSKPVVPTLALVHYSRHQTVGVAGVASYYLPLTTYISVIHSLAGRPEDQPMTRYSKHKMLGLSGKVLDLRITARVFKPKFTHLLLLTDTAYS